MKRALSFMDLDGCPPDASWERAKCCKKPKLADAAVAAVSGDMRVVPPTVVLWPRVCVCVSVCGGGRNVFQVGVHVGVKCFSCHAW